MIVEKDNLQYYGDKNGNPDVLLYAPNNYLNILKYIKINKIKKIALCGGGLPSQEYLYTIKEFEWIEYINGYSKGLDYSFLNTLPNLKKYIGCVDFELSNNSIEELYIGISAKTRINNECKNLKILEVEGCNSILKLFSNGCFPEKLNKLVFSKGKFESCKEFQKNSSIEEISFLHCPKLKSLENISNLKNLKILKIENCKVLSDISELEKNSNLKQLFVINCPNLDMGNLIVHDKIEVIKI